MLASLYSGSLRPIESFELLMDAGDPPSSHPSPPDFRLFFPRKLLGLTSSISHTREVHIPSPSFISLISLNSVYHMCPHTTPLSASLKTPINATRWISCACCLISSNVLPRAMGIRGLGHWTPINVNFRLHKDCCVERGDPWYCINGVRRTPALNRWFIGTQVFSYTCHFSVLPCYP
jgi:hypothetical protein